MRRCLFLFVTTTLFIATAACAAGTESQPERPVIERTVLVPSPTSAPSPTPEPSHRPTPITDAIIAPLPVRTEWPVSEYHADHEDCRDHGFGGRSGNTFFLIDMPPEPITQEIARRYVAEQICFAGKAEWAPQGQLEVKQARFLWTELEDWYNMILTSIPTRTAHMWDMQEAENIIIVGLSDMSEEAEIRAELANAGIPQQAVRFEYSSPLIELPGRFIGTE